eukprot:m51a1_g7036 hypothetical protein (270) ;mRNA; r:94124-95379
MVAALATRAVLSVAGLCLLQMLLTALFLTARPARRPCLALPRGGGDYVSGMRDVAPGSVAVTLRPAEVVVWHDLDHVPAANASAAVEAQRGRGVPLSYVHSSRNFRFHGRFAAALMLDAEFVWAMRRHNAIIGGMGRGWAPEDLEVDLVGQSWLVRAEWLRLFWSARMPSWDNGEDIDLAASLSILAGIRAFVPRMPRGEPDTWKDVTAGRLGGDAVATYRTRGHVPIRHNVTNYWLQLGWRTLANTTRVPLAREPPPPPAAANRTRRR